MTVIQTKNAATNEVIAPSTSAKSQLRVTFNWRTLIPSLSLALVLLGHRLLPVSANYRVKVLPHFWFLITVLLFMYGSWAIIGLFVRTEREKLAHKSWFLGASFLTLGIYNIITLKLNLLPSIYFPAPERIIAVFATDWQLLLRCLIYSLRLLLGGFFLGAFLGVFTGVLIGWSQRWNYWVMPFIRVVGPIPSTAWIPVALVVFIKPTDASLFLIALGVWFPTTVLTSSGILNVKKSYFEVSSTLGASTLRNVLSIALPAAAPSIFAGLFNGTSACFLTLMAAEMIGCKFGIGWYINWQRETLAYSNVYAALIVIAVTFSLLIGLQLKIRNRVLSWQKGTIRW
jgi:NitT/TauT family transport system permease protein